MNDETANNQSNERSSSAETIEIFKPSLIDEKAVPLSRDDISYADKIESDKDGLVKVKLEDEVIMQRVSKDLYKSPESGFRELFNNEARACRYAKAKHGAKPEIKVILDPMERSLVIQGFDSMGMSMEMFNRVFTWAGRSTNFDSGEIGQFGLGRFAYVQLSDTMLLETYSRETGEKYAVLGKSGTVFQKMPRPDDLNSYGTRVSMVIKDNVKLGSLLRYIADCARFTGIDCFLHVTDDLRDDISSTTKKMTYNLKGVYKIGPYEYQEYLNMIALEKFEASKNKEKIKINRKIPLTITSDAMDIHCLFVVLEEERSFDRYDEDSGKPVKQKSKHYELLDDRESSEFLLLGTPIRLYDEDARWGENRFEIPADFAIVNIKDERRFPPTADREGFNDAVREEIVEAFNELISEKLSMFNVSSIEDWKQSEFKDIIPHVREIMRPYLNRKCLQLIDVLNTQVSCLNLDKSIDNDIGFHYKVMDLVDRGISIDRMIIINDNKRNTVARLLNVLPDYFYIHVNGGTEQFRKISLLTARGARLATEVYQNYKHLFRRTVNLGEVTAYSAIPRNEEYKKRFKNDKHTFSLEKARLSTGEFPLEKVVKIPYGKVQEYTKVFNGLNTKYLLLKDDGLLPNVQDMQSFVNKVLAKKLVSSDGEIMIGDLMPYSFTKPEGYGLIQKKIILVECFDNRVLRHLQSDKAIYVAINDDDTYFEIGVAFQMHQRPYQAGYTFYEFIPAEFQYWQIKNLQSRLGLSDQELNLLIFQISKELPEKALWMTFVTSLNYQALKSAELKKLLDYIVDDLGPRVRSRLHVDGKPKPEDLNEVPKPKQANDNNDEEERKSPPIPLQDTGEGSNSLGDENYDANYNFCPKKEVDR